MARAPHTAVQTAPPPPGPTDVRGWEEAVKDGSYRACRLEDVVIALQDLRQALGKPTEYALAKHLSDCMFAILRGLVGTHHPNNGEDIIEEVHMVLWTALLKPESADGKGLRKAFTPRLKFRLLDVLRRVDTEENAATELNPEVHSLDGRQYSTGDVALHTLGETQRICEKLDVEAALSQIKDPKKRLAFRLFMDDVPFKSTKGPSIEKALDISERTARKWVGEAQEILKTYMGDAS
jgi:hypothetical protein